MNQRSGESDDDDPERPIEASLVGNDELQGESKALMEPTEEPPSAVEGSIRIGSPFAVDPVVEPMVTIESRPTERLYDVGPMRYTAMGAVAASLMVVGFAAIAAWWFPEGGTLIAALGCVLSIFGFYSDYRVASASLLAIHLCLFIASYGRALS